MAESVSSISSEGCCTSSLVKDGSGAKSSSALNVQRPHMKLLDLYSGCGAMSTGLCQGAAIAGIDLITVSNFMMSFLCIEIVYHL